MSQIIYSNCTIITLNPMQPRASAVVTEGGRIVAIGEREELEAAKSSAGTRTVDLQGATIVPGFDDCHMHIMSLGFSLRQLNLRPEVTPSISAIRDAVSSAAGNSAEGRWILGRGYNQNLLIETRHPNRDDLDAVSGDHPVVLWHTSGHVLVANSRALELAGIADGTASPAGGEIDHDAEGKPTGVVKERAMDLIRQVIPVPTPDELVDAVIAASAELAREGITSASDAATGQHAGVEAELAAYVEAHQSGRSKTRMVLMPLAEQVLREAGSPVSFNPEQLEVGSNDQWLKRGSVKIFADGALTTRTAAMRHPYLDTGAAGILTWEPAQLTSIVQAAARSGWDVATHAIGDRAIECVLDAYESIAICDRPKRLRIEHCTICDKDLIARMRRLDVTPVLQPEDIAVLGDAYEPSLGAIRAGNNSPVAWFAEHGLQIAFSSDRPVTPGHPLVGVRAAVERRTAANHLLGPQHRVSAEEALRYYSIGSAFASRCEAFRGALNPGMAADFVALDRDITTCPPDEITEAKVLMTVVGGGVVYQA